MNPNLNPKFDLNLSPKRRNRFSVRAVLVACAVIAAGAAAMHRYYPKPAGQQAVAQLTALQRAELAPAEAPPAHALPPAAPPDGAGMGEEDLVPPPEDGSGS
jgi:hypothetical protein